MAHLLDLPIEVLAIIINEVKVSIHVPLTCKTLYNVYSSVMRRKIIKSNVGYAIFYGDMDLYNKLCANAFIGSMIKAKKAKYLTLAERDKVENEVILKLKNVASPTKNDGFNSNICPTKAFMQRNKYAS
jgi:hypothetical protein